MRPKTIKPPILKAIEMHHPLLSTYPFPKDLSPPSPLSLSQPCGNQYSTESESIYASYTDADADSNSHTSTDMDPTIKNTHNASEARTTTATLRIDQVNLNRSHILSNNIDQGDGATVHCGRNKSPQYRYSDDCYDCVPRADIGSGSSHYSNDEASSFTLTPHPSTGKIILRCFHA
ncbi:hypothetical protein TWF694_004357 [Orbilia ellipsospora]|uniref:Uncharacterized protein n=1 Tax=Orbilia ellipsospora TaxID=2528407 RepID=A0AAV9WYV5_9PEZI